MELNVPNVMLIPDLMLAYALFVKHSIHHLEEQALALVQLLQLLLQVIHADLRLLHHVFKLQLLVLAQHAYLIMI